jgi:hypothetical protein
MLKKILSISGRPGLYQLVSYGKNMLLVDTIPAGHRFPIHSRERVMSLGDISIFTTSDDVPLSQVLENVGKKYDNKAIDAKAYTTPEQLHEFMNGVLENWDAERVHNSDIKKIIAWYNVLVGAGITDFSVEEEEGKTEEAAEEKKD